MEPASSATCQAKKNITIATSKFLVSSIALAASR